jgi:integrase
MANTRGKALRAEQNVETVPLAKIAKNPRKRRPQRSPTYLTEDERERLFRAIRAGRSARDLAVFTLAFHHGLRASEPGILQYSDYIRGPGLGMDRLHIHRKKGSISGEVVLVPAAARALRAWIRQRGYKPGPLFNTRQRSGISRSRVFALMVRYGKLAGLPEKKLHFHVLKHSCAVDLANYQREGVLDIRAHLGHASINSTMVYTRLLDEAGEDRARRLAGWR